MVIKNAIPVQSLPMTEEAIATLYPDPDEHQEDRQMLASVIKVFSGVKNSNRKYSFFIEKQAQEKFLKHVNDIYKKCGHEATGLFVGYYLHYGDDESRKVAVATGFLPAFGDSSVVTCEIGYEDAARNAHYCLTHKVLPLAQGHTHPFPGHVPHFSSVDFDTHRSNFAAPHQMAFVCNNLSNKYTGYKMNDGEPCHESIYCVNLKESLRTGDLVSECLYEATPQVKETPAKFECPETPVKAPRQSNKVKTLLYVILIMQIIQFAMILFPYIMSFGLIRILITDSFIGLLKI